MEYNKYVKLIIDALRESVAYTVDSDGKYAVAGTYVFFDHAKFSPTSVPKRIYYTASHMARDPRDFIVWRPIPSEATLGGWESPFLDLSRYKVFHYS